MRHFRPWDRRAAARQCLGFTAAAAIAQLINFLYTPVHGGLMSQGRSLGIPLSLLVIAVLLARYSHRAPDLLWTAIPLLGVVGIVILDVTGGDVSVQAQVFLFFPVLFAASQLPRGAAWGVTAVTVFGEILVTFSNEPPRDAFFDCLFVGTALAAAAMLLTHSTTVRGQLIDQLGRQARVDALTGLMTRYALNDVAWEALDANALNTSGGTALILIDLDRFKAVNDTYGHPVGDDYLVHVARFLSEQLDGTGQVARLGGDEFAVLVTNCSHQTAQHQGQALVAEATKHPFRLADGDTIPIRFTTGVSYVPPGRPSTLRDLYAQADRRLYRGKSANGSPGRLAAAGTGSKGVPLS